MRGIFSPFFYVFLSLFGPCNGRLDESRVNIENYGDNLDSITSERMDLGNVIKSKGCSAKEYEKGVDDKCY